MRILHERSKLPVQRGSYSTSGFSIFCSIVAKNQLIKQSKNIPLSLSPTSGYNIQKKDSIISSPHGGRGIDRICIAGR
jgi:hypothetical protein